MRIRHTGREEKIRLQMTPMIDIVFQLLVFFIMTFKIVLPEGDFNIRMPSAASQVRATPTEAITLTLHIVAGPGGELAGMQMGDVSFGSDADAFLRLHQHVRSLVSDAAGPGSASVPEVELDCDYDLRYEYAMRAFTAITGYLEGGRQHTLIERIKFASPREP